MCPQKRKSHTNHKTTLADFMPASLINFKTTATPDMQKISQTVNGKLFVTMHTSKEMKTGRYFENVELITVKQAKELAKKNKFTSTLLGYKGKKLLGYLRDAKNIPPEQRIFKIKENDRLKFTDGTLRFCNGEKFIHYDKNGEEYLSASV